MDTSTQSPAEALTARAETQAQRALRQNRTLATGLLVAMIILYAATSQIENPGFITLLIRAAAEAGIVGGMADWFAVTALFRHPLGLPIPHTAILPNNKDRIGRALGNFVEQSFLTPDVLLPKLRRAEPARRFAEWLATPAAGRMIADPVVASLPQIIRSLENSDLHDFAGRVVGEKLREADFAPVIGRAIQILSKSGETDVLFEQVLDSAANWLQESRQQIDELVRQRSRWWVPKAVDHRIATAIVDGVIDVLFSLRQPESEARLKFRESLDQVVEDLIHSPEQKEQVNAIKNRLLDHPEIQLWLGSIWSELSRLMLEDAGRPDSKTRIAIEKAVNSIGRTLAADQAMQARLDQLLESMAERAISWRGEIGNFIVEVVKSWDARTLSDRLELVIGSDLQYIRMNGTLVGALVGCMIFLLSSAVN